MSVNKERLHVLVLPEDDANRQLAIGFRLGIHPTRQRQIDVLIPAGGWEHVLRLFSLVYVSEMYKYPTRFMVLLIDFDGKEDRLNYAKTYVPEDLSERVFVLGALSEPEALKQANLGHYETIGSNLARDCREEINETWGHDLLIHNASELDRLRQHVRAILFDPV